jgi:hypothetical protein
MEKSKTKWESIMMAGRSKERILNQILDVLLRMEERLQIIESELKTEEKKEVLNG